MTATNDVLLIAALMLGALFFHPRLLNARLWRATVTPLASIIGSGFLVAGPILDYAAGTLAWLAMLGLCAVAYLFGAAIRHNILHVEPEIGRHPPRLVAGIEQASDLALSLAYFVSVAYYLNLFAAFGLRLGDIVDPFWIRAVSTAVIASVGVVGALGGLRALERLEVVAVGLKLSLIGGLFAALGVATALALAAGDFAWHAPAHARGAREVSILLGLVILVQGFETSRYLGAEYDAATRVKTMRWAQWIATAIYLVFVLLITRYFTNGLPAEGGETAIIDMLAPIGAAVAPMIIVAALASQLSAAVADLNGAGGLLAESSGRRLRVKAGNLITALVAIAITWTANIYEIIAYASKVFVIYYGLQSLQAAISAWRRRRFGMAALFSLGVLIASAVILFAAPADVQPAAGLCRGALAPHAGTLNNSSTDIISVFSTTAPH
jgi:hypothetical protein